MGSPWWRAEPGKQKKKPRQWVTTPGQRRGLWDVFSDDPMPGWLEGLSSWSEKWAGNVQGGMGLWAKDVGRRFGEAWERPREREPIQGGGRTWAQSMEASREGLGGLGEKYQQWVRGWAPDWLTDVSRGAEEIAAATDVGGWQPAVAELPAAVGAGVQQAGQWWQGLTERQDLLGAAATGLEQVGAVGMEALDVVGEVPKRMYGTGVVAAHPEAEGLTPEELYPLMGIGASMGRQQLAKASPFKEGLLSRGSVVGEALRQVKAAPAGERVARAEQVAGELYEPFTELGVAAGTDPLNMLDWMSPSKARRTAKAISAAADEVTKASKLDEVLEVSRGVDRLTRGAEEAGRVERLVGKWDDFKRAVNPFELTAESKAALDQADTFDVVANLVGDAESAEEAAYRLRMFADDPKAAAGQWGEFLGSKKGERVAETLRQIEAEGTGLEGLEWLRGGRPFKPEAVALEIHDEARNVLERLHGVKEAGGYPKFAKAFKGTMSELYMNLNPGYAVRNALNNAVTLAYDGLVALDKPGDVDRYLARMDALPARLRTGAGGAVKELTGETSRLPGVLGKVSEAGGKLARQSPIGEEAFYKRGFGAALRRTMGRVWHNGSRVPSPPAEVWRMLGPEGAADLVAAVASGANAEEVVRNARRALNPQRPGDVAGFVMRYVDEGNLDDLSPATWAHLQERVLTAQTPEDVSAAVDEVRQAIVAQGDAAYRRELLEPSRTVFTESTDAEVLANFAEDMAEDARRMGVTDPRALRLLEEQQARIRDLEAQLQEATSGLMQQAGQVGDQAAAEVVYQTNRRQAEMVADTRQRVDELRRETWELYDADPRRGNVLWPTYFAEAGRQWEETFGARLVLVRDAGVDLERLAAGEMVETVTGRSLREMIENRNARLVDLETMAATEITEATSFEKRLDVLRAQVDTAEGSAWRVAMRDPGQDALDIMDSADRYVQDVARKWRAESNALRNQYLADSQALAPPGRKASKEARKAYDAKRAKLRGDYREAQDTLAREMFEEQGGRWQLAEQELRYRESGGAVPPPDRPTIKAPVPFERVPPPEGMEPLEAAMWERDQIMDEIDHLSAEMQAGVRPQDPHVLARLHDEAQHKMAAAYTESRKVLGELADADRVEVRRLPEGQGWALDYWRADGVVGSQEFDTWRELDEAKKLFEMERPRIPEAVEEVAPSRFERLYPVTREIEESRGWAQRAAEQGATRAEVVWDRQAKEWAVEFVTDEEPTRVISAHLMGRNKKDAERVADLGEQVLSGRAVSVGPEAPTLGEAARIEAPEPVGEVAETFEEWERRWMAEGIAEEAERVAGEHPQGLDDAARLWGYDPEEMELDEWGRLSQALMEEHREEAALSTPEGLNALADQAAHTGKMELKEVGGVTREARARTMTRKRQADYRRGLMGEYADSPKEFYQRQKALAQWYYDLAEDAARRAAGEAVPVREAPVFVLEQVEGAAERGREAVRLAGKADEMQRARWTLEQGVETLEEARRKLETLRERAKVEVGGVSDYQVRKARAGVREAEQNLTRYIDEGRGVGVDVGRAEAVLEGETVQQVAAARAEVGAAEMPTLVDLVRVTEPRQLAALDAIEAGVLADWERWQARMVDAATERAVMGWLEGQVLPAFRDARMVSMKAAQQLTDFALLNYEKRNRIDEMLSLLFPYHFWYTRSGYNWFRRMVENPGRLALYARYKRGMKRINEDRGLRQRFEGKWRIKMPEGLLPEWMDPAVYVDPTQYIFPFATFDRTDWDNDEEAGPILERLYQGAKGLGLRPYAFIELPLQYAGALGESRGEIGAVLPQTGVIKGATALAGVGPAGGVNIEAAPRRALGLGKQEPWGPYRVERALSSMAAEDPGLSYGALRAQELQRMVAGGEIELEEATGETGGEAVPLALQAIQAEYNWTDEELQEARALLREALTRAGQERGVSAVASFVGLPLSVVAKGEQRQLELQREGQGLTWAPERPEGSRAEYDAWRAAHPEQVSRSMGYQVLPGEEARTWWTPGTAANVTAKREERARVVAEYDQQIDALLRQDPTAQYQARALGEAKRAALEELDLRYPVPDSEGGVPVAKYGQTPAEYARAALEEELRRVQGTLPQYGDFDEAADYYAAREEALAALPESVPVLEMAQRAGGTRALTLREALESYFRRYDTPLQALQSTYFDEVYYPAMEDYNRRVEAGEAKDEAWEATVGAVRAMEGAALVQQVLARNPDRGWTAETLAAEYAGVRFPSAEDAGEGRKSPEERQLDADTRAFWEAVDLVPWAADVRRDPVVALVLDKERRETATAEQVEAARAALEGWLAEHPEAEQAAAEAQELRATIEQRWPGVRDVESAYFDLPKAQRSAYLDDHPELREMWDYKDEFKAAHPVYVSLYDPDFDPDKAKGYGRRKAEYQREPYVYKRGLPWWEKYPRRYRSKRRLPWKRHKGGDQWWRTSGSRYTAKRPFIRAGL